MTAHMRSLLQSVEREAEICQELVDLLQKEEQLLISNELEPLMQLSQSKSQLVGQFVLASQTRYKQLAQAGLSPEDSSMNDLLMHQPEAHRAWNQFLQLVMTAKELNRTNGLLLQRLASRNQNALMAIQGRQSSQLYGPDGQKGTQLNFRSTIG